MKIRADSINVSFDFVKQKSQIVIETRKLADAEMIEIGDMQSWTAEGKLIFAELKKDRPKRSIDSNAYCWELMNQLAEYHGIPVTDIYRSYVKEIGGNNTVVCVQNEAADKLCEHWSEKGLGWITDRMDSKVKGCTNVVLYFGSSCYTQEQMGRMIDLIVQDCKDAGIETMTPDELRGMI